MISKSVRALRRFLGYRIDIWGLSKFGGRLSWLSQPHSLLPSYIRESFAELRKVNWTTRRETLKLLLALMVFTGVLTVIIGIFDNIFSLIVKRVFL